MTFVSRTQFHVKAVVAAFNQEKALVGAFSVITNLRMELFQALLFTREDDSPASHHEAALPALEEAGDDEGLVGAAGHDTDVQTHARLASDNWPLAARATAYLWRVHYLSTHYTAAESVSTVTVM